MPLLYNISVEMTFADSLTVFIRINAPSLLNTPHNSPLPLQRSYFGVLHPSQQPAPLRF